MVIVGLNQAVQEVFTMVGFDMLFHTFPDIDLAVEHLTS